VFDRRTGRTQTMIDEYEAIQTYNDNMGELLDHNIDKNESLTKEIDDIKSSIFTNDRRYNYYEESIDWQWYVNKIVRFVYWCCVAVYIFYFLLYKGQYVVRRNIAIGAVIFIIPFIISHLLVFQVYGYSIKNILDRFIQLFIFNKNVNNDDE
jgi:hypothetical protein